MSEKIKNISKKIKNLDKGTIVRTISQLIAYINQFIAILGYESFAESKIYQWISLILTIIITCISYWYNNDWSNSAQSVRDIFDMIKDGKITIDEITEFIKKHNQSNLDSSSESDSNDICKHDEENK